MSEQITEQEIFDELDKNEIKEELIKDNKFQFPYLDKLYRVLMPNQSQIADARRYKNKTLIQLIQDGTPKKAKWISILKEQNVDIEALENETDRFEKDLIQLHISRAKTKDNEVKTREKINISIEEVEEKRYKLVMEVADHLAPCADVQAREEYMRYLTALCTEVCTDNNNNTWERVWKSFEDYQNDQSAIAYVAEGQLTSLMLF